jgi:hypothetical protein
MLRAGQDLREAARRLRPLGTVEPDGILVLLVEADRALGAVDLVGIAHLPPRRRAAEIEVPHRAGGKAHHYLRVVVVVDGHGAVRARAEAMQRLDPG